MKGASARAPVACILAGQGMSGRSDANAMLVRLHNRQVEKTAQTLACKCSKGLRLTSFLFCRLQVCRLSFLSYVIKLHFEAESSTGAGSGQEIEKTRTRARRYKATRRRIESVAL
jgi:hypothetical protein